MLRSKQRTKNFNDLLPLPWKSGLYLKSALCNVQWLSWGDLAFCLARKQQPNLDTPMPAGLGQEGGLNLQT